MKLFFAFTALAAASTTPQPTTGQSTAAEFFTATGPSGPTCNDVKELSAAAVAAGSYTDAEEADMWDNCDAICAAEGLGNCNDVFSPEEEEEVVEEVIEDVIEEVVEENNATVADTACVEAETALADASNELEKIPLREACKLACVGVDDAECGSLVNSLSIALFAILAILKY